MKKTIKREDGITLIALVLTIVIILILAVVTINMVIGSNGVLTRAQVAKQRAQEAKEKEELYLRFYESIMLEPWDGTIATKFSNEDEDNAGEESNPYKITNGAELAYFAKCVNEGNSFENKYISIENSINLGFKEFEPIGSGDVSNWNGGDWIFTDNFFEGTLNGNGNVITGLQITQPDRNGTGLIGILGSSGTVENLNIYKGKITGRRAVGAFSGGSKGKIRNCINGGVDISGLTLIRRNMWLF